MKVNIMVRTSIGKVDYEDIKTSPEIVVPEEPVQYATLDVDATKMQEPFSVTQHLVCLHHKIVSPHYNQNVCEMPSGAYVTIELHQQSTNKWE